MANTLDLAAACSHLRFDRDEGFYAQIVDVSPQRRHIHTHFRQPPSESLQAPLAPHPGLNPGFFLRRRRDFRRRTGVFYSHGTGFYCIGLRCSSSIGGVSSRPAGCGRKHVGRGGRGEIGRGWICLESSVLSAIIVVASAKMQQ